ncbi:hypothetical protein [Marinicauda salina]|uniref:hypothetical protein n=1 Tax=Marinicauda salina TaxID=2135793 RepID=UPI001304A405|nr:hypothetical protein [Marinicauda salina]
MPSGRPDTKTLLIAGGVVVILVLAFFVWRETRTETIEFRFGGQEMEIETGGR